MLKIIIQRGSSIVSFYFIILSVYAGLVCAFLEAPYIKKGKFYKEASVAKYGGIVCAAGSIALYIISIFIK